MKKSILFPVFLFCFLFFYGQNNESYSKIKINISDWNQLTLLAKSGVNLENLDFSKGAFIIGEFSESEIQSIDNLNLNYEILIPDMTKFYLERNKNLSIDAINNKLKTDKNYKLTPSHFHLGSMGGYLTLNEIYTEINEMNQLYPDLISDTIPISNTNTTNGNKIYYVKLESTVQMSIQKPQVLLTALTHAREPAGMQQLIYFMWYLLENYNTNPEVKYLVDHLDLYFVPCVNPDGYRFNQTQSPNGGGMWRKNRTFNGNNSWGVDLNRNYGYQWGYDNIGSSNMGDDETYRGTTPFSEVETQQIKLLCETNQFSLAINNHCYGNMLIYPWGYLPTINPDSALFRQYAQLLTEQNHFIYGTCYEVLNYTANGGSSDWFYGEQTTKNRIIEFSPEAGDSWNGFWPAMDQIEGICHDYLPMNLALLRLALPYAKWNDLSAPVVSTTQTQIPFSITSLGNIDQSTFHVSFSPITSNILSFGDSVTFSNMEILETISDSIMIQLDNSIHQGDSIVFEVRVNNGYFTYTDTVIKYFGNVTYLVNDDCTDFNAWNSPMWNLTASDYHSPSTSITDSPNGNYYDSNFSSVQLNNTIDLTGCVYAYLDFYAKWALEYNFDFVQILISSDGGNTWTPMASNHSLIGGAFQDTGNPVYHGFQNEWVHEMIPLTDFIGEQIKIQFIIQSDQSQNYDGFYFDDFHVVKVLTSGVSISEKQKEWSLFYRAATNSVVIQVTQEQLPLQFTLFDAKGSIIHQFLMNNQHLEIPMDAYSKGIYIFKPSKGTGKKVGTY